MLLQGMTQQMKEAIPVTWNCFFSLYNWGTVKSRNWEQRIYQSSNCPIPHFHNAW
jgi:hypothetical protein